MYNCVTRDATSHGVLPRQQVNIQTGYNHALAAEHVKAEAVSSWLSEMAMSES